MNHFIPDLTMRSKENLYKKYNGYGVLFVKTRENETQIIEFNLGRNGKFATISGRYLTERLDELGAEILKETDE